MPHRRPEAVVDCARLQAMAPARMVREATGGDDTARGAAVDRDRDDTIQQRPVWRAAEPLAAPHH